MQVFSALKYYKGNSLIIMSLMVIGLTAFMLANSFISTTKRNSDALIRDTYTGDYIIESGSVKDELVMEDSDITAIEALEYVTKATRRISLPISLVSDDASIVVTMIAVEQSGTKSLFENFDIPKEDFFGKSGVIALNKAVADENGLHVGDALTVYFNEKSLDMAIGYIFVPKYTNSVLDTWCVVQYRDALDLLDKQQGYATEVLVDAATKAGIESDISGVVGSQYTVKWWEDTQANSLAIAPVIWRMVLTIMMISMFLIICVGCAALVVSSLLGRTSDMAVYKALGYRTSRLMRLYLCEVYVIFFIAAAIAALLATVAVVIVNHLGIRSDAIAFTFVFGSPELQLILNWQVYLLPILICAACCLMIMCSPIHKITKKQIIDILNED